MRTAEDLERLWSGLRPAPCDRGTVALVVQRRGDERHATPTRARLSVEGGLEGDRWCLGESPDPAAQVTLMNVRVAELIADGRPLHLPGDNLLVDLDLGARALPAGSRLRVGTAVLEVSDEPHLGCRKFAARFGTGALRWVNADTTRARRLRGVNCRVVADGVVAVGDPIERL